MATSDSSLSSGDDASFGVVSGSARAVITAADFEESADDAPENAYLRARRESPRRRSRRNVPVSSPSPSPSARRRSRGRLSSSPTREGTTLEVDDDAPSAEVDDDAASPIATTAFPARLRVVAPDEEDDPDVPKRGARVSDASGAVARAVRSLERRGESAPESTATTSRPHPAPAVGASRATSVDDPPRTSTRDPSEKTRARRRSGQTSDTRAPVSSSASSPPARGGASAFAPKNTASVSASADAAVSAGLEPFPPRRIETPPNCSSASRLWNAARRTRTRAWTSTAPPRWLPSRARTRWTLGSARRATNSRASRLFLVANAATTTTTFAATFVFARRSRPRGTRRRARGGTARDSRDVSVRGVSRGGTSRTRGRARR